MGIATRARRIASQFSSHFPALLPALALTACGFPRPDRVGDGGDDPGTASYQLLAVEPSTATTGDTVMLEGTFGDTATVNFPGGASQSATVLGPHRATVVVPEAATIGPLTVDTAGTTVGPLRFRHTTFSLGLQPVGSRFAQAGGARQASTLTIARARHAAVVIETSLYVIGGKHDGTYLDSIEHATINADGSLGPFAVAAGIKLTTPRAGHTSVVIGSFLYVIGGAAAAGALNTVERAAIGVDGSISSFSEVPGITLQAARDAAAAVVIGNFIYEVGGVDTGALGSVERATVQPDGTLSPFATVPGITLGTARSGHTATIVGRTLYVLGGTASGAALSTVERATINPDGTLSNFAVASGVGLAVARTGHTTAVVGDYLYNLGGTTNTGALTSVERAAVGPDDTLGAFQPLTNVVLDTKRTGHASVLIAPYLYQLGGSSLLNELNTLERSPINATAALTGFSEIPNKLINPSFGGAVAVIGQYLYVLGGAGAGIFGSMKSVQRAIVNSDGSLGPFTVLPDVELTTARSNHASVVIGDYLYVLGGQGVPLPLDSVERALIRPDGTLETFTVVPDVRLTAPRFEFMAFVVGSFVYLVGGNDGVDNIATVDRAVIQQDGSLGNFSIFASGFPRRGGHTGFIAGTTMVVVGGITGKDDEPSSTLVKSVERAIIAADGSIGSFDGFATQLVVARAATCVQLVGGSSYVFGGSDPTSASTLPSEHAEVRPDGFPGQFAQDTSVPVTLRVAHSCVSLENSMYLIGGQRGALVLDTIERAALR